MTPAIWLSPRECEVLCRMAQRDARRRGRSSSTKWVADQMGISEGTARSLASRAYKKLGASTRHEAYVLHPPHGLTLSQGCYPLGIAPRAVSITSALIGASSNI